MMFLRKRSNDEATEARAGLSALLGTRNPTPPRDPPPTPVRVGVIGRGHAGKTAVFRTMAKGPLFDFLPSGLQLDLDDPLDLTAALQQTARTIDCLQHRGLDQTLDTPEIHYFLLEGERKRLVMESREVVGQVLTHTTKASPPEQLDRYKRYVTDLAAAHVLWTVIPCPPPNATAADRDRYANDLKITAAYVKEALRHRSEQQPIAVAIMMTKVDTLFPSAAEARRLLPDHVLKEALGPLVNTVVASAKVSDAAILPVSAFGFGNAVLKSDEAGEPDDDPDGGSPTIESGELEWVLRPGGTAEPYNFATLMVFSLLFGLLNQEVDYNGVDEPALARICRLLSEDVDAVEGWYVPVKGRLLSRSSGAR